MQSLKPTLRGTAGSQRNAYTSVVDRPTEARKNRLANNSHVMYSYNKFDDQSPDLDSFLIRLHVSSIFRVKFGVRRKQFSCNGKNKNKTVYFYLATKETLSFKSHHATALNIFVNITHSGW